MTLLKVVLAVAISESAIGANGLGATVKLDGKQQRHYLRNRNLAS